MNVKIFPSIIKNYFSKSTSYVKKLSTETFKPLAFEKQQSIRDARGFAAINFKIKDINTANLNECNEINQLCTKIYNLTEGQIKFPPNIDIKKQKNSKYTGAYCNCSISIIKSNQYLETFIHELAHYNHENATRDYVRMGKRSEIKNDMFYPDYAIFDKFTKDNQNLKLIKKYLGGYATSSPCEFIAEMFVAIVHGKKLPQELFKLYKEYEGPCHEILLKQYKNGNLII